MPASSADTNIGRKEMYAEPTHIRGEALTDDRLRSMGKDPRIHMGIHYDRKSQTDEDTGRHVNGPIPDGMSGGPVWLILPEGTPVLIAIGTEQNLEQKVLLGTNTELFLAGMSLRFGHPGVVSENGK